MNTQSLKFPVVIFDIDPSATFDLRIDEASLLTTTPLTLKHGIYYRSIIVDSQGNSHKVVSVKDLQQSPLRFFADKMLNNPIKIEIELDDPVPMELDDFKSRLVTAFQDQTFAEVWKDAGLDMGDFHTFIDRSNSFETIILYLLGKTGGDLSNEAKI